MMWALHGAFGSAADWERREVQAVDLWEEVAPFEQWATGFVGRVREVDEAPSLLGYSMGGRLALHALLAAPELWKSAVIVSAHPGLEDARERELRIEADAKWAQRVREDELEKVLEDWQAQAVFEGERKGFDLEGLEGKREAVARSFEEWSLGGQEVLWDRLGEVGGPVLWVTGERDEKFTELAERAVGLMPRARHVVIEGCGHRVPWEKEEVFWGGSFEVLK